MSRKWCPALTASVAICSISWSSFTICCLSAEGAVVGSSSSLDSEEVGASRLVRSRVILAVLVWGAGAGAVSVGTVSLTGTGESGTV